MKQLIKVAVTIICFILEYSLVRKFGTIRKFQCTQDDFYARKLGVQNYDMQKLKDSEKLFYEKLIEKLPYSGYTTKIQP